MAEFVVGMKPTAANQFKRGGFLKVQPKQSHCRVGLNRLRRIFDTPQFAAGLKAQSASAHLYNSADHRLVLAQSAAVFRSLRLQENLPV